MHIHNVCISIYVRTHTDRKIYIYIYIYIHTHAFTHTCMTGAVPNQRLLWVMIVETTAS